jgi:hypothetical protein
MTKPQNHGQQFANNFYTFIEPRLLPQSYFYPKLGPGLWRRPPQEPLCDATLRNPQITTVCEGEPSVVLGMPILPWVARQALPHVPLTQNDPKHTDTRHPLPDFYLQNTCKFAVPAAAWITALAMGTTQHDTRLLTHCWPPKRWNAAHALCMATRAMGEVTIAAVGSHGGCLRSPKICDRAHTPHAASYRPCT